MSNKKVEEIASAYVRVFPSDAVFIKKLVRKMGRHTIAADIIREWRNKHHD